MDEVGEKFEIGLFNERNNCTLWQSMMKNLLARSLLKGVGMKLHAFGLYSGPRTEDQL